MRLCAGETGHIGAASALQHFPAFAPWPVQLCRNVAFLSQLAANRVATSSFLWYFGYGSEPLPFLRWGAERGERCDENENLSEDDSGFRFPAAAAVGGPFDSSAAARGGGGGVCCAGNAAGKRQCISAGELSRRERRSLFCHALETAGDSHQCPHLVRTLCRRDAKFTPAAGARRPARSPRGMEG